jgi:tetrapyrrole methylase family protein/MazG family protein
VTADGNAQADHLAELLERWGVDPTLGLQVASPDRLPALPVDPTLALVLLPSGAATKTDRFAVLPGRHARPRDPLAALGVLFPPAHPVRRADGSVTVVGELDASDLEAPLYVAAAPPLDALASPHALPWISARLRAPDGCPWDREQDHATLRRHLLEEAHEVYEILDQGSTLRLAGELGDLLLQIVLHAQFAAERGVFDMSDVYRAIGEKVVRRHPHVFGDEVAETAADVSRNWERIKSAERDERGEPRSGALSGISASLPALAASQEMQDRAASLGYDWPDLEGVIDKIGEEAGELLAAGTPAEEAEEFGDLLMVIVNLGRRLGIDAEASLRSANAKFRERFEAVLALAQARSLDLSVLSLDELDALWREVKATGRPGGGSPPE